MIYDAFISYRHSETDMFVAKKVHKGLETFKVPKSVAKAGGKSAIKRVFRDQEELPIGSDLNDNISAALAESEYLLVICSPRTPESFWVKKEITTFISLHDREHVLAILVEGEPNESFPEELLVDEAGNSVEPLAADVRGADKKEMSRKLKTELIRLAAPILHCTYDDLKQRHKERKMKQTIAWISAIGFLVAVLGIGFGIYNANMAKKIQKNYEEMQISQSKYLAETSHSLLKTGNREAAVLIALEALPSEENARPYVPEAEYALNEAMYTYSVSNTVYMERTLSHALPVDNFVYDATGKYIVSVDFSDTTYLWNVETGKCLANVAPSFKSDGYIESVLYANVFSDKLVIVNSSNLFVYSLSGDLLNTISFENNISYAGGSVKNNLLWLAGFDGVCIYDMTDFSMKSKNINLGEDILFNDIQFSYDGNYLTGQHSGLSGDDSATVFIYNRKTSELKFFTPGENSILDLCIGNDGIAYVSSVNSMVLWGTDVGDNLVHTECFDFNSDSDKSMWDDTVSVDPMLFLTGSTNINVTSKDGKKLIGLSLVDTLYSFDEKGKVLSSSYFGENITDFFINDNLFFIVSLTSGKVNVCDPDSGYIYPDSFEVGYEVAQFDNRNGLFAFRCFSSSDIILMKKHTSPDLKTVYSFDERVSNYFLGTDKKSYCFVHYTSKDSTYIYSLDFFDSASNKLMASYKIESYPQYMNYIDNEKFLFVDSDKSLHILFVNKESDIVLPIDSNFITKGAYISPNGRYCVVYGFSDIRLYDLSTYTLLKSYSNDDESLMSVTVNNDASTMYCLTHSGTMFSINTVTGEPDTDYPSEYCATPSTNSYDSFFMNSDCTKLCLCCRDNVLRIFDTVNRVTLYEIPFSCRNKIFATFIDEDRKMFLQGDDYFIKIYDFEKGDFTYLSSEPYNTISSLQEENDLLILITYDGMLIFTTPDYSLKAYAEYGKLFVPDTGLIYSMYSNTLYSLPYVPCEEVINKAHEAFPDSQLSDSDRIKYHVD